MYHCVIGMGKGVPERMIGFEGGSVTLRYLIHTSGGKRFTVTRDLKEFV